MAGKRLGNVFVELGLDSKEYTKGEAKILQQSKSTSLLMEQNWRTLGGHSDQIFNAMKANITNAYNAIANNAKSSAAEIIRAEQAKNAKIKQLNEQQLGSHTSFLSTLKANWIAASVAIYAAMQVASEGWNLLKKGAKYEEEKGILDNLAKKYSQTADSIVDSMRRASNAQISNADLMSVALGGLAKGLKPEQLINLANAAKTLGDAVGVNATTALKDLAEALETGRVRALKHYAGVLDLKTAFGDLEGKLTDTEKAQALYSLTMLKSIEIQKQQKGAVDGTADDLEQLEAKWNNLTTSAARYFKIVAVGAWNVIDKAGDLYAKIITGGAYKPAGDAEQKAPDDTGSVYQKQIADLKNTLKARKDNSDQAINARLNAERQMYKDLRGYSTAYYEAEKKLILDQAAKYKQLGIDKVAIAAWVAEETEKLQIQQAKAGDDFFAGMKAGWDDWRRSQATVGLGAFEMTQKAIKSTADELTKFVTTGKADFKSLADSIIQDLIRIQIQKIMTGLFEGGSGGGMLGGLLGKAGGFFGNLFGGGSAANYSSMGGQTIIPAFEMHTGGVVGESYSPTRYMPASLFANAPRLHGGNEYPAILERGETVIPKGRSSAPIINIINNNNSEITTESKETSGGLQIDVIIDQMVAKKMGQFGSQSNKMIRNNFSARDRLIQR